MTSFPPNRYVPITRTLLTILTFRVSFIHFSQLTPPPPRLSIHTSYFLAPYSASSRYRSQSLSPTRRVPPPPRPDPFRNATNMSYLHCTPLRSARGACCCRLLLPTIRYVNTTEIGPSRLPTSLGAILVPLMCTRSGMIRGVAGNWSRHILGWCHINFIKPKTYSALLPPKAYDSPRLWNEFMRVTKHFLQRIFRYYDVCMTHFLPYDSKTNIWANTVQILQKQALTTTCNKHMAELTDHTLDRLYKAGHWAQYVTQSATYVAGVVGHDMLRSQPRMICGHCCSSMPMPVKWICKRCDILHNLKAWCRPTKHHKFSQKWNKWPYPTCFLSINSFELLPPI